MVFFARLEPFKSACSHRLGLVFVLYKIGGHLSQAVLFLACVKGRDRGKISKAEFIFLRLRCGRFLVSEKWETRKGPPVSDFASECEIRPGGVPSLRSTGGGLLGGCAPKWGDLGLRR